MLIVKYTLFEAYKRKLWASQAFIALACCAIALYAYSLSITESSASYIIFYTGSIRVCSAFILGVYIIVTESRNWESERIQNILSLPVSRFELVLQKTLAYLLITMGLTMIALPALIPACGLLPALGWLCSLYLELCIVMSVALMLSAIFHQPLVSIILMSVFYIFARSAREFYAHAEKILSDAVSLSEILIAWPLKIIVFLVPHLSQFSSATALAYPALQNDAASSMVLIALQAFLYCALLFAVTYVAIKNKSF